MSTNSSVEWTRVVRLLIDSLAVVEAPRLNSVASEIGDLGVAMGWGVGVGAVEGRPWVWRLLSAQMSGWALERRWASACWWRPPRGL